MNNITTPEQFASANKASVETMTKLANQVSTQFERLAALNVNTARSVLEDSVAATKTVLAAKNPQDLFALQATLAKPMLDKAVAYGRSVYEIAADGRQQFTEMFEAQVAELNKTFTEALEKAAKSAPAGSEAAFAAVKSALGAANNAYESVSKATKQATAVAEAKVVAATEATVNAANTAVKALSAKKAA
jgi:phasin family protein